MAYTKIIKINSRLDRAINYVLNKDKNSKEETIFEGSINCLLSNPYKDMINTKKLKIIQAVYWVII